MILRAYINHKCLITVRKLLMKLLLGITFVYRLCWQHYTANNDLNACHAEQPPNKPWCLFFPAAIVHLNRMTLYDLCISHPECQHALGCIRRKILHFSLHFSFIAALICLFISQFFLALKITEGWKFTLFNKSNN